MNASRIALLLFLGLVSCDSNKPAVQVPDQKWTWSTERLEKAVGQVRAGRDLTPKAWPNSAKVAVLLSFDVDNETVPWW